MNRDQIRAAVAQSLLIDDSRDTHRNVYPLRRRPPVDETRVRAELYARPRTRVESVVPVDPDQPPAA